MKLNLEFPIKYKFQSFQDFIILMFFFVLGQNIKQFHRIYEILVSQYTNIFKSSIWLRYTYIMKEQLNGPPFKNLTKADIYLNWFFDQSLASEFLPNQIQHFQVINLLLSIQKPAITWSWGCHTDAIRSTRRQYRLNCNIRYDLFELGVVKKQINRQG